MISTMNTNVPAVYNSLLMKSEEIGFTMPSDIQIGSLLKTLIASKPNGHFLELGTGIGLSLSWMLEGMDSDSKLVSLDVDNELVSITRSYFKDESRVDILNVDAADWLQNYSGACFDLIFADAWPGKYSHLDQALAILKRGGYYVVDDMNPQDNWPEGHEKRANEFKELIIQRNDLVLTELNWSTGVIIGVKK